MLRKCPAVEPAVLLSLPPPRPCRRTRRSRSLCLNYHLDEFDFHSAMSRVCIHKPQSLWIKPDFDQDTFKRILMITSNKDCFICWLNSGRIGHTLTLNNAEGRNLYSPLLQHGPVWCSPERALIVHQGLWHIHLKSGPFSLSTDTLNDGPQTMQNGSLYAHKCSTFQATTVCPPPLPLLFRYLHISERCRGTQKIFSTFIFSQSVKRAHFKASICAEPLINSAHAASLGLPLLKYWVLKKKATN